jgi:hypothetical protein
MTVPWYIILFAVLFIAGLILIIGVFTGYPTKTDLQEISRGPPGPDGITYPKIPDGKKGSKGFNGDPAPDGMTYSNVLINFIPNAAEDQILMAGNNPTSAFIQGVKGQTISNSKMCYVSYENITVVVQVTRSNQFWLRFTLPSPIQDLNQTNIISTYGYVNTINAGGGFTLVAYAANTVIVNANTVRVRYLAINNNFWVSTQPPSPQPTVWCYLQLYYIGA